MNCYLHPETAATAFCRACGRPLCALCQRTADGTVYCQDHAPVPAYTSADPNAGTGPNPYLYTAPVAPSGVAPVNTSPGLAWFLGLIPGVGAIYNGQYLKGLVHALVLGLLITLVASSEHTPSVAPMIGILLTAFWIYMPFEAYHTAKKRQAGIPVDEWSSIVPRSRYGGRAPLGPIVLIVIGVLYLLNTLDLVNFAQIARFWPVILIVAGAYMLYSRLSSPDALERPRSRSSQSADSAPTGDFAESRNDH